MRRLTGKLLKNVRREQGLTQVQIAEKLDVQQATISNWETGRTNIDESAAKKLVKILGNFQDASLFSDRPALGAWLRSEREVKGLSVSELAQKAKLTPATIYNLEAGRIQNPQDQTRVSLEKALGTRIPQDIADEIVEESFIEGIGELHDFDPHITDKTKLPNCPGVYVFYDITQRPVYIGQAKKICDRVINHSGSKWFIAPVVVSAAYVKIEDKQLRHQTEQVLIKFLKRNILINKQSVDRDSDD